MQRQQLSLENVSPALRQAIQNAGGAFGTDPLGGIYVGTYFEELGLVIYCLQAHSTPKQVFEEPPGIRWWKVDLSGL